MQRPQRSLRHGNLPSKPRSGPSSASLYTQVADAAFRAEVAYTPARQSCSFPAAVLQSPCSTADSDTLSGIKGVGTAASMTVPDKDALHRQLLNAHASVIYPPGEITLSGLTLLRAQKFEDSYMTVAVRQALRSPHFSVASAMKMTHLQVLFGYYGGLVAANRHVTTQKPRRVLIPQL